MLWIGFPFVVMVLIDMRAKRWSEWRQRVLRSVIISVTGLSLIFYAYAAFGPPRDRPAPYFVSIPPLELLAMAVALVVTAMISRRQHHES
jgi:hypothetical protein